MAISPETIKSLELEFQAIQDEICNHMAERGGKMYLETKWSYDAADPTTSGGKSGGGRTRCFEVDRREPVGDGSSWVLKKEDPKNMPFFEKGACNFSGISGPSMPPSAVDRMKLPADTPFHATGVSLIFHPSNPHVPTIHMNVRFFCCGDRWWFGGGVDVTPYYPILSQVVAFHTKLKALCDAHGQDYEALKKECDEYFLLAHRKETRGVGGLFWDGMNGDFDKARAFTMGLGHLFNELYDIFLDNATLAYTDDERLFQLYRRGRYVEFNLVYDRGTKFGLASNGRTESILVSLPSTVHWTYDYTPPSGSNEAYLYNHFLRARNWLSLTEQEIQDMQPPAGYGGVDTGKIVVGPKDTSCCCSCKWCSMHVVVGVGIAAFAAFTIMKKL
eukprot:m.355207 g.355207  ORF g.355207 m.355207 type:complete len:388 (+) comp17197_c0_seq1:411-1574(+)